MRLIHWIGLLCTATLMACSAAPGGGSDDNSGGSGNGTGSGGSSGTIGTGGSSGTINTGGGGSSSGGSGAIGGECAGVTEQAQGGVLPADVIWAIDTSCSMAEETAAVQQNMNAFSQQIANAGVDVRIVLLAEEFQPSPFPGIVPDEGICIGAPLGSGSCPGDTKLPNFAHIYQTIGSTDSLQQFISTYPTWQQQLRPNAVKIFVVVTDDNSAMPAATFTQQLNALDPAKVQPGQWRFHGIYCYTNCPSAAEAGTVYAELVNQTQGVSGDLCLQNFKPVFDQLASGIVGAAKLSCIWAIPAPPDGQTFDKTKVNVEFTNGSGTKTTIGKVNSGADCGPQGGWYYDDENNPQNVIACPATCQTIQADPNGKIAVQFGCATVIVPT